MSKQPEFISLLALIHAPEMYEGQTVRIVGLCSFLGEVPAMWAATEYYNQSITRNAVGLDLEASDALARMHGQVMLVEADFTAEPDANAGRFSGMLTGITRIERWGAAE